MPSRSKWGKYRILKGSEILSEHIPSTLPFNRDNFRTMLARYGQVVVKPRFGYGGKGVQKVRLLESGACEIRRDAGKKRVEGLDAAYAEVRSRGGGNMIVQRYIPLARLNNRPFDLRVMVQRKSTRSDRWTVTGKLAKVAGKGYFITNVRRSRGKVMSAREAIGASNVSGASASDILRKVEEVALLGARRLGKSYRWIHTIGFDIGVDQSGKVWIIEPNFKPDLSLFRKLSRSAYRRIRQFR